MSNNLGNRLSDAAEDKFKFEQYVLPEMQMLLNIAKTLTRNTYDAEDLVQETLLKAFKGIKVFDGKFPKAWLITIMRNTLINKDRKRRPGLLKNGDEADKMSATIVEIPDHQVESKLFMEAIMNALKRLPKDMIAIVQLVDVDGLSYPETSLALGIPIGTVTSRLHRARKQIRKSLEKSGYSWNTERS